MWVILSNSSKLKNILARTRNSWSDSPVIRLETIDSTNNYAMQLIDADSAPPGTVVVSRTQTQGRGQRGKAWQDQPGSSLLLSLVVAPVFPLSAPFAFSASVALGVTDFLETQALEAEMKIKWPNDIVLNDKKAGGLLIENLIKGQQWVRAVVGLGLNVGREAAGPELPRATSLNREGGAFSDPWDLISPLRRAWEKRLTQPLPLSRILEEYQERMYRKGQIQRFRQGEQIWEARILGVNAQGQIGLERKGISQWFSHGSLEWVWDD